MEDVIQATRSSPINKALANGNSTANQWTVPAKQVVVPTFDGFFPAGHPNQYTADAIWFSPYCEGAVGSLFSVRLFLWRVLWQPDGDPANMQCCPYFQAEFLCTACNAFGTGDVSQTKKAKLLLSETECDTITLTQGSLGPSGYINATGPGTDLVAHARVSLLGARYFSFDFCQFDTGNPVSMNALWALS